MDHFKIYSLKSETENILKSLQNFGDVHISNLSEDENLQELGLDELAISDDIDVIKDEIRDLEEAIDLLGNYGEDLGMIEGLKKGNPNYTFEELMEEGAMTNCSPILNEVHRLDGDITKLDQKIESLKAKRKELEPWKSLKIESDQLKNTKATKIYTGYINPRQFDGLKEDLNDLKEVYIGQISLYEGSQYAIIIGHEDFEEEMEEAIRKNSFLKLKPFWTNKPNVEILEIDQEIKNLKDQKKTLVKTYLSNIENLSILKIRYEYLKQVEEKYETKKRALATQRVSLIEGFVPRKKSELLEAYIELEHKDQISLEITEARDDDSTVPTLLENSSLVEPFENLTEMYSLPKYNEIDPTPFLAPFYWIFFGMMLADFGYGLLLTAGSLIALSFNLSDSLRRMMKFFASVGVATMIWGIIYGSFFGGVVPFPGGFQGFIDPGEDYITVMIISLLLGGIHMFTGLAIGAAQSFKDGEPLGALYDYFSWYMVIGGAIYAILANVLGLPGFRIALYIMVLGMIIVVLFTARDQESNAGRIGMGLYNLYGISSWIGDFVSYLRLLALGLSGAFIGVAINMIVQMMTESSVAGLIFGLIILAGGHLFNLALSGLSAYVHTLRLTFVEFFDKFYDGNGTVFSKFRSDTKYINIKEEIKKEN